MDECTIPSVGNGQGNPSGATMTRSEFEPGAVETTKSPFWAFLVCPSLVLNSFDRVYTVRMESHTFESPEDKGEEKQAKPEVSTEDIEQAKMRILLIRGEVAVMGANDSEITDLNHLLEKLENREVSPEDAVIEASRIQSSKMDYH